MRPESITDEEGNEVGTYETEGPHPPERMVPRRDRATEGRVNPKGIPCLYLSDDRDTAMTEARPWIGSYVTVCQFKVLRNLNVVDCTLDLKLVVTATILGEKPNPADVEAHAWKAINNALSKPVTRNDDVAEYAPTQVLAEAFRGAGYEGIVYGSRLGKGKTVALFDLNAAKQINGCLFLLESLNPVYEEVANPYYLKE
jgi:RES domain-containing protein